MVCLFRPQRLYRDRVESNSRRAHGPRLQQRQQRRQHDDGHFPGSGNYAFTVVIEDPGGLTNSDSSVTVAVAPVLTSISLGSQSVETAVAGGPTTFSATALDQFGGSFSPQPAFQWSVTAGRIDGAPSGSGVFTPPGLSMPCEVTVSGGGVSCTEPVAITDSSPESTACTGDSWIEPLFEQALGSSTQGHLARLDAQADADGMTFSPAALWRRLRPAVPSRALPPRRTPAAPAAPSYTTFTTSWVVGSRTYTARETDWLTDAWEESAVDGGWGYHETRTANYEIDTSGGPSPTVASGALTCTLYANGGNWGSEYDFSVTATATAGGTCAGGNWGQTTSNKDFIDVCVTGAASESAARHTAAAYSYSQPYSGGTSAQPVNGTQQETANDQVSYEATTP